MTIKSFLRTILNFFTSAHISCSCGGVVFCHLGWDEEHFVCDKCNKEMSRDEFERLSARQKNLAHKG